MQVGGGEVRAQGLGPPPCLALHADEEVVEIRSRIKLADNEAVILKDGQGKYHYRRAVFSF